MHLPSYIDFETYNIMNFSPRIFWSKRFIWDMFWYFSQDIKGLSKIECPKFGEVLGLQMIFLNISQPNAMPLSYDFEFKFYGVSKWKITSSIVHIIIVRGEPSPFTKKERYFAIWTKMWFVICIYYNTRIYR